ncbi:MAG: glycosyltransferase [Chloroflexota bacterium]
MKAVLIPVANGYGSTVRLLAVAKVLRSRGHEAVFAAGDRLHEVIAQHGFEPRAIVEVEVDEQSEVPTTIQFLRKQAAGDFLERQVKDVIRIIRDFRANVVIFSQSNAAAIAAGVEDLPSVSIFHPTIMEFHDWQTFTALFVKWRKFFALKSVFPLKREVPSSILGDLNFIPSIPPLVYWPFIQAPEIYLRKRPVKNIGGLIRTRPEELPSQAELKREFGVEGRQFIYATLGGAAADPRFLGIVVDGLRRSGCKALLTPGGGASQALIDSLSDENVRVVRFLPEAMRAIKACDVLVWHGGHETMLEAVAAAKPAIGIPIQFDQDENVSLLEKSGAGVRIDRRKLAPETLAEAIARVLSDPAFAQAAQRLKRINDSLGGPERLVEETEALVERGRRV